MANSATVFIVAAPSGAGKTSLVNALLASTPDIEASVSHTTREPRPGEIEGKDYFFVDRATFERLAAEKVFLEHAEVHGAYYGTSQQALEKRLNCGVDVILEIDWQGAQQIREKMPQTQSIFILPPSLIALHERLTDRGQDKAETIARRTRAATAEMSHFEEFDYLIFNDDFHESLIALKAIVTATRHRRNLQASKHHKRLLDLLNS